MRYRLRVSRAQFTERVINAPDEETAVERMRAQLDRSLGFIGPWTTGEVEVEIVGVESRVGDLPSQLPEGPLLLSVKDATQQLGISRSVFYELIRSGEIEHVRVGRRVLISQAGLRKFVETNSQIGYSS
jgi:excisionase family DNA binding protein